MEMRQESGAALPGTISRDTVEVILEAAACLAGHAILYAVVPAAPHHLAAIGWRGGPDPDAAPTPGEPSLAERALATGRVEPSPLPAAPDGLALPIIAAQRAVAVLYLGRPEGTPFTAIDLSAARAVAAMAGWLIHREQLHLLPLQQVMREERDRIAGEIHDGVSQNLALLMLKMEIISLLADSDPARMKLELSKVVSLLEASVQQLRSTIDTLRSTDRRTPYSSPNST